MCVPTSDGYGCHRRAVWTARRVVYRTRRAPSGYVDGGSRHNFFSSCTVVTSQRACLDKRGRHPGHLRTAEGRRRPSPPKLLVTPSDLHIYIYIYIYAYDLLHTTPTTYYIHIYIYIYIFLYPPPTPSVVVRSQSVY